MTAVVDAPLHTVWSLMLSTEGEGFTVISKLLVGPVQPLAVGVTVTVAVTGRRVRIHAAEARRYFRFPDAAKPIVASLFVQAYVVPATRFAEVNGRGGGPVAQGLVGYCCLPRVWDSP